MKLRVGVVIIGSLLWDNQGRKKWRESALNDEDKFQVYLPIRYGRLSIYGERKNTYTMVFSNKCHSKRYGLGTGWVCPVKAEITSFNDLKREALRMGKAEGFANGLFSDWGSVGLLINPKKKIDLAIKDQWTDLFSGNEHRMALMNAHLKGEKFTIDSSAFLAIRWPKEKVTEGKIEDMDVLIATATEPTLIKGKYPNVYQIANAMKTTGRYAYFLKNREHSITTFQDERILGRIFKRTTGSSIKKLAVT